MATRKSPTKAKPKAKKSTSKVKAARTTKSTTKSAVAARSSASSKVRIVNILQLRRILAVSIGLYTVLAVAAGVLMGHTTYELTVGYLTKDELASRVSTVFGPATHVLYDLEIRWVLVALLVLSLVFPILYLTKMERRYTTALKGRTLPWRWIDLGVSAALMVEVIALISGVQDVMTLKLVGGLMAITAALGWVAERQNENSNQPVWGAYVVSLFSGALPWLLIAVTAIGTAFYGAVRSPWYVYALYGATLVGFILMAINQCNQHRRFRAWKNYLTAERNYLLINLVTKVAFAVILIVGLRSH